ncbi:MAG: AAA family ATPase, partial [Deltaproteobacteria bacterium]|nr:AAA family ATPase [Deltaproteobacteria bacterium]
MIERHLKIRRDSKSSFFLFGARGTGKTTFLRSTFSNDEAIFIDLLDPVEQDLFSREPRELERRVLALRPECRWIVIDEIQKAPRLLDIVHKLIESGDRLFALTGSSSRKLKRGVSNLLAGRAFVYNLFPFSSSELGDRFELVDGLKWGMLPGIQKFDNDVDKQHFLRAYALTYIKEEIQEEQLIRKLDPFRQFLEVAAQTSGKIVNYSKIA